MKYFISLNIKFIILIKLQNNLDNNVINKIINTF